MLTDISKTHNCNTKIIRGSPGNIVACYVRFLSLKPHKKKKKVFVCFASTFPIMVAMYDKITKLTFNYSIFIFHKISNEKTFKNIRHSLWERTMKTLAKPILIIETNITLLKNKDFNIQLYIYNIQIYISRFPNLNLYFFCRKTRYYTYYWIVQQVSSSIIWLI